MHQEGNKKLFCEQQMAQIPCAFNQRKKAWQEQEVNLVTGLTTALWLPKSNLAFQNTLLCACVLGMWNHYGPSGRLFPPSRMTHIACVSCVIEERILRRGPPQHPYCIAESVKEVLSFLSKLTDIVAQFFTAKAAKSGEMPHFSRHSDRTTGVNKVSGREGKWRQFPTYFVASAAGRHSHAPQRALSTVPGIEVAEEHWKGQWALQTSWHVGGASQQLVSGHLLSTLSSMVRLVSWSYHKTDL